MTSIFFRWEAQPQNQIMPIIISKGTLISTGGVDEREGFSTQFLRDGPPEVLMSPKMSILCVLVPVWFGDVWSQEDSHMISSCTSYFQSRFSSHRAVLQAVFYFFAGLVLRNFSA